MVKNKQYSGYKSWSYLEPDVDYIDFKLPSELGRFEPYIVPVSKEEEERAIDLLEKSPSDDHRVYCRTQRCNRGTSFGGQDFQPFGFLDH